MRSPPEVARRGRARPPGDPRARVPARATTRAVPSRDIRDFGQRARPLPAVERQMARRERRGGRDLTFGPPVATIIDATTRPPSRGIVLRTLSAHPTTSQIAREAPHRT